MADNVDFVEEMPLSAPQGNREERAIDMYMGILPIADGVVIDHISKGQSEEVIWAQLERIRRFMGFTSCVGASGVYPSTKSGRPGAPRKGLMSLPNLPKEFD